MCSLCSVVTFPRLLPCHLQKLPDALKHVASCATLTSQARRRKDLRAAKTKRKGKAMAEKISVIVATIIRPARENFEVFWKKEAGRGDSGTHEYGTRMRCGVVV